MEINKKKGINSIEVPKQRENISQSKPSKAHKSSLSKTKNQLQCVPGKFKSIIYFVGTAQKTKEDKTDNLKKGHKREMSIEEKISDYNEKEAFADLIKYAKKGDRIGFINTMER